MKKIAFIPARAGSQRVKLKNIRVLAGHPLIAYAINAAVESKLFDAVMVSTDSQAIADIALHYGAEVPFLRPEEFATTTSPDIEWLSYTLNKLREDYDKEFDIFSIVRATSPFRNGDTIKRANEILMANDKADSVRAVSLCKEHPGKMWTVEGDIIAPFMSQGDLKVPYHARQYQDLPEVYIQNSSLEMAWTKVVEETNSREGKTVAPLFSEHFEGFAIDYEEDWLLAEQYIKENKVKLPEVSQSPFVF